MMYIKSSYSISCQQVDDSTGNLSALKKIDHQSELFHPEYKNHIAPRMLRRMSKILKMGVYCGLKSLDLADVTKPDAIVTATGLGCLNDTMKFLDQINAQGDALLSPTPFIQSTHNTVGGQIALATKSHVYNMTYVQQHLSFECALLDAAMLLTEDPDKNVLIGGIDEHHAFLDQAYASIREEQGLELTHPLSEGSSFFVLTGSKNHDQTEIIHTDRLTIRDQDYEELRSIIARYNPGVVLYGVSTTEDEASITQLEIDVPLISYKQYCGEYFTHSAFGIWLGDQIIKKPSLINEYTAGPVAILNKFSDNVGLTILS